jgi:hypothetical protein
MKLRSLSSSGALVVVLATSVLSCKSAAQTEPKGPVEEAPDESWVVDAGAEKKKKTAAEESATEDTDDSEPELKMSRDSLIEMSIDYGGAVLVLGGDARLIFPKDSVGRATVHFAIAKQSRKGPGKIGKTYEFAPAVSSEGSPFIIELPLPRGKKKANFAVSRIDEKGGSEKLVWDIKEATSIDTEKGVAVLETNELSEGWFHLTTKSP